MQTGLAIKTEDPIDSVSDITEPYLRLLTLIERLHRQLLEVIKDELEREGQNDVNAVQALLIYNIGDSELTAGELRTRGHYLGSNVSYNLKKLVEAGYIRHKRSDADRRSVRVSLTDEGRELRDLISALFERHLVSVEKVGDVHVDMVDKTNLTLDRLERFWIDQVRYRL
ncbi:transcriptional regulator LdtR [Parvularcula marina]|jgi:DNA-binding MarR family transcriptional regulator|uniref:MarR family transcriptional regulator n=1 Tax=Parvularcula marina TaxID=2292771 RepID=A0A371RGW5_9PROT|nr:winged helix DNA-binding protein [Parvularcula marina]RFB04693.1 MarR family transcriptional regulator [Parvularcula marina]